MIQQNSQNPTFEPKPDEEMETTVPLKTVTGVILIVAGLVVALYEPKLRRR